MRIGIVRTASSPCRCAESVAKGLEFLGHTYLLVDSEEIEAQVSLLAEECDLVIDHTDTYRGRGFLRPLVRVLLENGGARVVGSDAKTCFLADDKSAAKARLSHAGIPVPPGIVIRSKTWELPSWLKPPLVLKAEFEHMSRGIRVVHTIQEAHLAAAELFESLKQPILVESFISGRELAVSILDGPEGLQVLPILEWGIAPEEDGVLTEEFKLIEPEDDRHRILKAVMPEELKAELGALALHAFQALGLRDYGRFDVRLTSDNDLFFLEANTTPSLEPFEALAQSAQWAGFDYAALVDRMLSSARRRYEMQMPPVVELDRIQLPAGSIEIEIAAGVHRPPESSVLLAGLLDVQPGEEVFDIGCGSGLLSIAAAKLGAARIVASDLDSKALSATERNARRNGVLDRIDIRAGSWYSALGEACVASKQHTRFDVIIATPPQTPGLHPFGPKYGGFDGAAKLIKVIEGAPSFLKADRGRLWIMAISLANPSRIMKRLHELFAEVSCVYQSERLFTRKEYEEIDSRLFEHFCSLQASGVSDFREAADGKYAFRNLFIRAKGPREI
jgi:D-alanine-D-alanine ligase-like ATP-grasp enzyme/methylase of polypeptide subunit release factors